MSIVFLRTATDHGPRTIVFSASESDARLLSERMMMDANTEVAPMMTLPDRGPYSSVAQIVAHRTKELDREIARLSWRNARRDKTDLFNVTKLFPRGKKNDGRRPIRKK